MEKGYNCTEKGIYTSLRLYDACIFHNPLLIAYVESFNDISFPRLTALHQRMYFFHLTIILYLSIGIGRCSHSCQPATKRLIQTAKQGRPPLKIPSYKKRFSVNVTKDGTDHEKNIKPFCPNLLGIKKTFIKVR